MNISICGISLLSVELAALAFGPKTIAAPVSQCTVLQEKHYGDETVRLAYRMGTDSDSHFAVFKAPLAVNTDGAPTSYHPDDFKGQSLAINRLDNAVTIKRKTGQKLSENQKINVFDQWRKSGDWTVPAGYTITWKRVISADLAGNPCIFKNEHAGYFGSLTALKNGLATVDAGECQVKNQLDLRYIPAIALRGNNNPLLVYGAKLGDLVVAINPANGVSVAAIIGDTGDGNRIGEGSVALNMALLKVAAQPKTYAEALRLDTGRRDMIIGVLTGTAAFNRQRPYTVDNITRRVESWAVLHGYASTEKLSDAIAACAAGL